jgi:peptide/nickel transport system permease protein
MKAAIEEQKVFQSENNVNLKKVRSPFQMGLRRFMNNKAAVVSTIVLFLIFVMTLAAPLLTHWDPTSQDLTSSDLPPSSKHLLGTNTTGQDYFARNIYGGRVDFMIAIVDMFIIMGIGIILGGLAGYYGGWVDAVIMRCVDIMLNFPSLLLIVILSAFFSTNSVWLLILIIAFTDWSGITRFVRGLFLNLREQEFVLAAKMSGCSVWRIIFRHFLPNAIGPLVVNATFLMAGLIGMEAGLSLIGFGVPPNTPSWGNTLNSALDYFTLQFKPWAWVPSAGLIFITILCFNFIGDGLRDAFDPSFEK